MSESEQDETPTLAEAEEDEREYYEGWNTHEEADDRMP